MSYKHFIAVLAVAFLFLVGGVAAQKSKNKLSQAAFEKMVIDDAPKAFKLAESKQLNFPQLQFFINYERENERNFEYVELLNNIYWQQLSHKDKLNSEHILFLENNFFNTPENNGAYSFSVSFAYVVKHQTEFKKAWKDSLFQSYVSNHLYNLTLSLNLYSGIDGELSVTERTDKAESYLAFIKQQLPDYEPYSRAYLYSNYVYRKEENKDKYFFWLNNYLLNFETDPNKLDTYAFEITNYETDAAYKPLSLVFINKALEMKKSANFYITKAEALYQLGQVEAARKELDNFNSFNAEAKSDWKDYYERVEKLINGNK